MNALFDLPVLPPIANPTSEPDTESTEHEMNPFRLIQPLDLSRYQLPSLQSDEAPSPVQIQVSHDRGSHLEKPFGAEIQHGSSPNPFTLSPPQTMQTSHSAPPSAAPYQPSFSFALNDLPHHPSNGQYRRNISDYNQIPPQPLAQSQPPSTGGTWPLRSFATQTYETPYQAYNLQPNYYRTHISHGHSHSTPNLFASPSQSYQSCDGSPFQGHSQLSTTPYRFPPELDLPQSTELPLPLQRNECESYELPEGTWESHAPYSQPSFNTSPFSSPHLQEKRMKRKENLVKGRKHVCPVCDKRFNRPSSLNTHMAVHTGAKLSSNLRRHERTHELRAEKDRSTHTYTPSQLSQSLPVTGSPVPPAHAPPLYSQVAQFSYNHNPYQPFNSSSYSDQLPPPPASQFGTSSTSSTTSSMDGHGGVGGLAQYQVVAREQGLKGQEMPRKGYVGMNEIDLEMNTKAGLLLA
uniref:C2H2-type domain-containing protein n=1 Tax=Kwoniella dejecticola CBS 10117 TaxID=1296121 RepID=A0A1A5ZUW2_9TREE|nr:uncharacterized protein I303_08361 [Kwoniella dejecticola CBS 10117]OBR81590.1 hypothetical protein I303_08361 [Kwoniella dejecticola CBS 10117]